MTDPRDSILDARAVLIAYTEAAIRTLVDRELQKLLTEWKNELAKILSRKSIAPGEVSRLRTLGTTLAKLNAITVRQLKAVAALAGPILTNVYRDSVFRNAWILDGATVAAPARVGVAFSGVNERAIASALSRDVPGLKDFPAFSGLAKSVRVSMRRDLAKAIAEGWNVDRLVDRWAQGKGAGAVVSQAQSVALTGLHAAANNGAVAAYKAAGPDVVRAVRLEATFDRRTCLQCGSLHRKTWPVDKAPAVPIHYRCRCVLLPVFADADYERSIANSQAYLTSGAEIRWRDANRSFDAWLRKQTPQVRIDFFPSTLKRFAFERGGMDLNDLVDRSTGLPLRDPAVRSKLKARGVSIPASLTP